MEKRNFQLSTQGGEINFEFGELAGKANGSALLQCKGTTVLATAVMGNVDEKMDYFPLMIDYEENYFAAGKIKGSRFVKRKGRPSESAILNSRLIDHAIRPLFDQRIRRSIQIIVNVLSYDKKCDPACLALNAAMTAVSVSDIPTNQTVAACEISTDDEGNLFVNTENKETEDEGQNNFDLKVASSKDKVLMLEAGLNEAPEEKTLKGIEIAIKENGLWIEKIEEITKEIGKEKIKIDDIISVDDITEELIKNIKETNYSSIKDIINKRDLSAKEKKEEISKIKEQIIDQLSDEEESFVPKINEALNDLEGEIVRQITLETGIRYDNRKLNEIRELNSRVGILPKVHGSGLFSRGETQALTVTTLGAPGEVQLIDEMEVEEKKRYIHHYSFPPFCAGEAKPLRGPGRREIGHGALAERALVPVIPSKEEFPYTILVHTEILNSWGSTSQAAVCGSTLSLMNAGVPIKRPVAGISIGLYTNPKDSSNYELLTDVAYHEDSHGDMDLKIAGSEKGITSIQMDIKIDGIAFDILKKGFEKAKLARKELLAKIKETIDKPAPLSENAPRIVTLQIDPDQIRDVIGPGGKIINDIIEKTGVAIDIEDDGKVFITSNDKEGAEEAVKIVKNITKKVTVGEVMQGEVVRIENFGVFVKLTKTQDGLIHVSKLSDGYIKSPGDLVKMGEVLDVKVDEIDNQNRINLSLIKKFKGSPKKQHNNYSHKKNNKI